jgi:preprotein translocase subunit SecF
MDSLSLYNQKLKKKTIQKSFIWIVFSCLLLLVSCIPFTVTKINKNTTLSSSSSFSVSDVIKNESLINQSVTLNKVTVINNIDIHSFYISDGQNLLIAFIPDNVKTISQEQLPQKYNQINIRGTVRKVDKNFLNKLSSKQQNMAKKQKTYIEISETQNPYSNGQNQIKPDDVQQI